MNYVVLCNVKLKRLTTSPRSGTNKATSVANACSPAHCLAEDIISLQTEELRRIQAREWQHNPLIIYIKDY